VRLKFRMLVTWAVDREGEHGQGVNQRGAGGGGEGSSSAVEVTEKEILESGTWSGRRLEGGCNPRARWPVPKQRRWRRRGGLEVEVGLGAWWLVDGTLRWGGLPVGGRRRVARRGAWPCGSSLISRTYEWSD
jgi:hypothetical protein